MPRSFSLLILSIFSITVTFAESFSERYLSFQLKPDDLFFSAQSEQEKDDFECGRYSTWRSYSKELRPHEVNYKGYILYADPFHLGQKRISFLLGSDCSHFTHRLFQLIGADYPFTKTRHFLHLAKSQEKPADYYACEWEKLKGSFNQVRREEVRPGDLMVYANAEDEMGERGHMGVVASVEPFLFLNVRFKTGYVLEMLSEEKIQSKEPVFFRYKGELRSVESQDIRKLLLMKYPFNNSGCVE